VGQGALASPMTFLLHVLVFCGAMLLFLLALVDGRYSIPFAGAGCGVLMLLACRCNYTGLLCHLYTNSEPFLTMMRPLPGPDPPTMVDALFAPPVIEGETSAEEETTDNNV